MPADKPHRVQGTSRSHKAVYKGSSPFDATVYDMSWATHYIAELKLGNTVTFRPRGNSMKGKVEDGQLCTVVPLLPPQAFPKVGDIVLCKVSGHQYLHLVHATRGTNPPRFQIGNNRGGINGWVGLEQIYGICIKVEP